MKRNTLSLLLIVFSLSAWSQNITLIKGAVNEMQVVSDSVQFSYSLYLPESYSSQTKHPVVYVFDPKGDGIRAARFFSSIVPMQDFIIVASNYEMEPNLVQSVEMAGLMMQHVDGAISIDPKHIYLAGLETGAITASALAYAMKDMGGVLAINGFFFNEKYLVKPKKEIIFGMVGDASPHYYKLRSNFGMINKVEKNNEFFIYDGVGGWPKADYLSSMLNHLYWSRTEQTDGELSATTISSFYENDLATVKALISRQNYLIAEDLLLFLKKRYRREIDMGSLRALHRELRGMRSYRESKRTKSNNELEEAMLLEDMTYFLNEDVMNASYDNLGYWDEKIRQFEKAKEDSSKPYQQKVAHRMLGFLHAAVDAYREGLIANQKATSGQRIFPQVLKTILEPRDYGAYLDIISLSAQDNDFNTAYFYLEEMLKNGFTDYEVLYSIPHTTALKITPVYNQIIEAYLGKSEYQ